MDKLEYQVVMHRIQEIEQEQLTRLYYICKYLDSYFDFDKENTRERMLQLRAEKHKLNSYIDSSL